MTLTVVGYLVLAVAVVGLEVFARFRGARIPTARTCLAYLMRSSVGRVAVLLAWLWLGWHFFAR